MKLFLDTSVALAASLSSTGASCLIFDVAASQGWELVVSHWVLREMRDNLISSPAAATHAWVGLRGKVHVEDDELTFDWPLIFDATKDKPVLFTALASADFLLTLDRRDFGPFLRQSVYGLQVLTPRDFLHAEREAGRLHT